MAELYTTLGESTLAATIDGTQTTLEVASAASFPATGVFRLLIEQEIVRVDSVSGTVFTVTRAQEGTAGVTHSIAVTVKEVVTATMLDRVRADLNLSGLRANLPSASAAKRGDLYWDTDAPFIHHHDGSLWRPIGPLWRLTPPISADFSWVQQEGVAEVTSHGGSILVGDDAGTGFAIASRVKTMPGTPYTITIAMIYEATDRDHIAGMCLRDSGSGRMIVYALGRGGTNGVLSPWVARATNSTTFSSSVLTETQGDMHTPLIKWMQVNDNGTNFTYRLSHNGFTWFDSLTESRTAWLASPNQIGYFILNRPDFSARPNTCAFIHWKET